MHWVFSTRKNVFIELVVKEGKWFLICHPLYSSNRSFKFSLLFLLRKSLNAMIS